MPPSPAGPAPVDAAAILNSVWTRNALRRGAQLPLLPVRETFEREWTQARYRAHVAAYYEATRARVLGELRRRHGPQFGGSAGGRWVVENLTSKALRASFRKL